MTDRLALILGILISAAFLVDLFFFHGAMSLFLARKVFAFVDFLEFWR